MNSENQKIKSKSKTLSLDFNSLKSMNDTNMDSIDKKIKNKYSSALDYLNSFSDKKSTIQNNSSINSEKFQKLKNEMLTSIYDNIHYSNYKTTNPQNYYLKQNNTRNNLLTLEKAKDTISKMYNDIRMLQDERIFARLNYLFKVLDYKNYFSDKDNFIGDDKERETFVFDCVEEIYNLMKLPKKNE